MENWTAWALIRCIDNHLRLCMDPPLLIDSTWVSLVKDWCDVLCLSLFFYEQRTLGRRDLDIGAANFLS